MLTRYGVHVNVRSIHSHHEGGCGLADRDFALGCFGTSPFATTFHPLGITLMFVSRDYSCPNSTDSKNAHYAIAICRVSGLSTVLCCTLSLPQRLIDKTLTAPLVEVAILLSSIPSTVSRIDGCHTRMPSQLPITFASAAAPNGVSDTASNVRSNLRGDGSGDW